MFRPQNATERLQLRSFFIPKEARLVPGPKGGAAYLYPTSRERFGAMVFRGTAGKPSWHYTYRTREQAEQAIAEFHASLTSWASYKAEQKAQTQATPNPYKVGDLVHTSWGYDQTNVDHYAVTRVSVGCVWVRKIVADYEATGYMCGRTWPRMPIECVGEETRHVVRRGSFSIDGHGASVTKGDTYTSSYA